jgi:hypothetical protein
MAFNSQVVLNDPSNLGGTSDPILVYDLQQALNQWSRYIKGLGTLTVQLNIIQTSVGREDGGPTSSFYAGNSAGLSVYGPSSLYELTNGQHVSGTTSDISIDVSPSYFQNLDLSQDMGYFSTPALNKYDPAVVFMHELLHGFGMDSYESQTGSLPGAYESSFDTLLKLNPDGSAYYVGANGDAAEGGPVRITTSSTAGENYSHFGNTLSDLYQTPSTVQDPLTLDLMNGIVLFYDYRYPVSQLDLGVLKDLGYTVLDPAASSDLTGDGKSAVLWYNPTSGTVGDWQVSGSTAQWSVIGTASGTVQVAGAGDFTGSGTSDILWQNPTNNLVGEWLMNNGQPTWQLIDQGSTTMKIAGIGDFNGNGTSDILWLNPTNNLVGEWLMNNGRDTWQLVSQGSTTMKIVGVGDFNGDGTSDVLWENPTNNLVGAWLMNSNGLPTWDLIGQGSTTMNVVGVGDFTGNGSDDVLWENPSNGVVGFWGMINGQPTSWNTVGTASSTYQVAAVGDYYGTGTSDILWRNPTSGDTGIWAMNNGQATWHDLGSSSTAFNVVKS